MGEKLILRNDVFKKELLHHKNLIRLLCNDLKNEKNPLSIKQSSLFTPVTKSGRELALVCSGLKCEKTGATVNLQFHHLITRYNKKIMAFSKYATQRHYYKNIVILSQKHHKGNSSEEMVISDKFISMVREKYFK